jgi:hypothetical protein
MAGCGGVAEGWTMTIMIDLGVGGMGCRLAGVGGR